MFDERLTLTVPAHLAPALATAEVDARLDAFFRNVEASRSDEAA